MASNSNRHSLECIKQNKMQPTCSSGYCGKKINSLLVLLVTGYFFHCYNAITPVTTTYSEKYITSLTPHECESIDIRNDCSSFEILENCTVIKGYLLIVLLPKDKDGSNIQDTCEYEKISFPLLREITDFFIMFHVRGLKSIRDMFPNLTVIRGQRLFLNYAVGVTEMSDLETIEFRSLVAIQRGHVFIGSSPKLCQLEKINWDRLTLSTGQNHIFPLASGTCKQKALCSGCPYQYCWSNMVCQKFENDNVMNPMHNTKHCHEECLGGCFNTTNAGCAVCRTLTDHGSCLSECPSDKYLHEHSRRCYTREECVHEMGLLAFDGLCLAHCPSGLISDVIFPLFGVYKKLANASRIGYSNMEYN